MRWLFSNRAGGFQPAAVSAEAHVARPQLVTKFPSALDASTIMPLRLLSSTQRHEEEEFNANQSNAIAHSAGLFAGDRDGYRGGTATTSRTAAAFQVQADDFRLYR